MNMWEQKPHVIHQRKEKAVQLFKLCVLKHETKKEFCPITELLQEIVIPKVRRKIKQEISSFLKSCKITIAIEDASIPLLLLLIQINKRIKGGNLMFHKFQDINNNSVLYLNSATRNCVS